LLDLSPLRNISLVAGSLLVVFLFRRRTTYIILATLYSQSAFFAYFYAIAFIAVIAMVGWSTFAIGKKAGYTNTLGSWVTRRVLELSYTAWEMAPLARDLGHDGPPFRWDEERRALLRAELDAAYFHLYGLGRDDTEYVLDTFRLVRMRDEKQHGEYRTKRLILDVYDRMATAIAGGEPFDTLLDPPPGQGLTHPDRDLSDGGARQS
jgi:hypothetical protein